MIHVPKVENPFYAGQPVPVELFRRRAGQIRHIIERGVAQVERDKPIAMFVEREYGIVLPITVSLQSRSVY